MLEVAQKCFLPGTEISLRVEEAARCLTDQGFETTLQPGVGVTGTSGSLGEGLRLHAEVTFEEVGAGMTMQASIAGGVSGTRMLITLLCLLLLLPVGLILAIRTRRLFRVESTATLEAIYDSVRRVQTERPRAHRPLPGGTDDRRMISSTRIRTPYISRGQSVLPPKSRVS